MKDVLGQIEQLKGCANCAHFVQIYGLCAKYICIHGVAVVFENVSR